ncbi:MAG: hypothetical protein L6R48_02250 [Planctomycetes bacterium]|nr:hypothetical protein [Planctomycetota bacterium]
MARWHLQDVAAALLAAGCLAGAAGAAWHLHTAGHDLAARARQAADRHAGLLAAAGGLPSASQVGTWLGEAARLDQLRTSQEAARTALAARRDELARERERCRTQARSRQLAGDGPFSPGAEPDPPGPNFIHPTWQAWRARQEACTALNQQVAAVDQELPGLSQALATMAGSAAAAAQRATALRDQAAAAQAVLDDPELRRELTLAASGPGAARLLLALVHLPVAGCLLALGLRALTRLALLRGWLGWKRLAHAR